MSNQIRIREWREQLREIGVSRWKRGCFLVPLLGVVSVLVLCLLIGCGSERSAEGQLLGGADAMAMTGAVESTGEPDLTSETVFTEDALAREVSHVIYVHVCGYVQNPGVYELKDSDRIQDAVEAAGGFAEEADPECWNLAQSLTDGEQIRIPSKTESESLRAVKDSEAESLAEAENGLVNLNRAGREELMTLPGIGEAKADAILTYRQTHGDFTAIEEIMNVSGIKEAGFQKIKDKITI